MERSSRTRMLACALSLGLALGVVGCSSGDSDAENDSAAPRPTPSVIAEPTQVPAPEGDDADTSDSDEDAAGEFDPADIEDLGAREGASGEALQDDAGYWYYEVTSGDVASVICDRFDRRWWQLETVDVEPAFDCRSTIYPGQILVPTAYPEDHEHDAPWVPNSSPFDE
ncbi:hypothetical protein [Paramicrobacterium chengjingii]|uniref:LysM domain-containing protein n=1 Tax=Paramicrobacterium chengjingii TaxID=2769067 RepID=A0ABX6YKM2_9MICO|nr:hypothetical protein [Microbacterium chengjingii]QPZ38895.1 hypothetical protein HCR76_01975 [Microbacterium chengjingii]